MFMLMSDAAAISQFTQANVAADVSMKVAVKASHIAKAQGAAVISLLETAVKLSQSMPTDPGKGTRLDVIG